MRVLVTKGRHAGKVCWFRFYGEDLSAGTAILSDRPPSSYEWTAIVVGRDEFVDFESMYAWFNWNFREDFLLEVPEVGCFTWSSPNYGGNDEIKKFEGERKDWERGISRGYHKIGDILGRTRVG